MVKKIILSLFLISISMSERRPIRQDVVPLEHQGNMKLFVVAGQSNASGRGDLPNVPTSNPQVYVFGNDYRWRLLIEPMDSPSNQVDEVSVDVYAGYSIGTSFGNEMTRMYPDMVIGIIPCARGGTSLYEWRRQLGDETLYGSCLKRALAASTMGTVEGFLFYQGEKDARDPALFPGIELYPDSWALHFQQFAADWRADLGIPDLPFVFAQIGTATDMSIYPNWDAVKSQQASVSIENCAMVVTEDVPVEDGAHFFTTGYREIGRRFATAYVEVVEQGAGCE